MLRLGRDMGFRATFDTWAQDCTTFPEEVRDRALAHVIKESSRAALLMELERDVDGCS
jgi:hypothetical protein